MARIEDLAFRQSETKSGDSDVNANSVVTIAAASGKRFCITGLSVSASAAPGAAVSCTITDGGATIERLEISANAFAPVVINYNRPIQCAVNSEIVATLPALGAGVRGSIYLRGYFTNE